MIQSRKCDGTRGRLILLAGASGNNGGKGAGVLEVHGRAVLRQRLLRRLELKRERDLRSPHGRRGRGPAPAARCTFLLKMHFVRKHVCFILRFSSRRCIFVVKFVVFSKGEITPTWASASVPAVKVVCAGGAMQTPQILMLSGVGPKVRPARGGCNSLKSTRWCRLARLELET